MAYAIAKAKLDAMRRLYLRAVEDGRKREAARLANKVHALEEQLYAAM